LPFLPKSPKCLKPGQLAKVIAKGGRIVVGKIRYVGPIANCMEDDEIFVGLQLSHALGDCDGSFCGKKFFEW
jgi:dynactin complex subunit